MIICSHNSMTYLPLKNWWLKPLNWIARCQNKDIIDQLKSGVGMIDIRVSLNKNYHWIFKHGLIRYNPAKEKTSDKFSSILSYDDGRNHLLQYDKYCKYDDDLYYYMDLLKKYLGGKHIYVRIILESTRRGYHDFDKSMFKMLCKSLEREYKDFTFVGGNYKKTWEKVYEFKDENGYEWEFDQFVSSMQKCSIFERICPWLYAKRHNKENMAKMTKKFNAFDFI